MNEAALELDQEHRQAFKILSTSLGKDLATKEWMKFVSNITKPRPAIIKPQNLFPDEVAMLFNKSKAIPTTLINKTLESNSGLRVKINERNRPYEWSFTPKVKGVRGPWHDNVGLGKKGLHHGHIYAVRLGANLDIIDDGILNIIPMSEKFNVKHYSKFEEYIANNLFGQMITITQKNKNDVLHINVPSMGIDVKAHPLTTEDNWPKDWYLQNNTWL